MQENGLDEQQANDQATRILNSENSSDEAHSSNFPFGIKGNSYTITRIPIIYPMQVATAKDKPTEDNGQVQRQRKDQPGPLKQSTGKELQTGIAAAKINSQSLVANTEAQSHNVRNEHISRTVEESKQQQHTNQQQETKKGLQNHHEQAVDQEEQWQVQKRKQTKNQEQTPPKTAWRPVSTQDKTTKSSMQQAPSIAGILSNIPTNNNYTNLVMQEQPNKGIAGDNTNKGKSAQEVQTIEGSRDDSPKESNHNATIVIKDHVTDNCYNKTSDIDLSLPLPHSPNIIYVDAENYDEVCGGMDGGCQEKPTNLQERVTKGGSLTHVLHEVVHTDHRIDLRASATPISVQNSQNVQENVNKNHKGQIADTGQVQKEPVDPTNQGTEVQNRGTEQIQNTADPPGKGTTGNLQDQNEAQRKTRNNKSQGKISKKKRNAIKRRQEAEAARLGIKEGTTHKSHPQGQTHKSADNDEYNVVPSEDEFDQDTQSLGENNNEEDDTSIHLIKAFGSTLQQEELQEVTDQQGLSPRGRLNSKQANNNTSANSSRPNTRSRSRGF
uniref:GA24436 n=1 Tax=Solanum tuberosum TaxID=4113 RepID=M1DHW5_SOLTU